MLCPLFEEDKLGPRLTRCRLVEASLPTKWHLDPSSHLATTDRLMGRKLGKWLCPFGGGRPGSPSSRLTHRGQGQGLPARQVSSGSVQPFGHKYANVKDRTGQRDRQRYDSIGRNVLQTVAQTRELQCIYSVSTKKTAPKYNGVVFEILSKHH